MSAREQILGRVRAAIADVPAGEPDHFDVTQTGDAAVAYERRRPVAGEEHVALFAARCGDYRANVVRCEAGAAAIAAAVADACARHGVRSLVVPAGVPGDWVPDGLEPLGDEPVLTARQLDECDGVLTGCALAIAQTGTIVLDAGPAQGRRALTLVPDLHICVVGAEQIVVGVPEGVAAARGAVDAGRALTLISGPSATSDIELKRVEGVHGPRRLEVVLAG